MFAFLVVFLGILIIGIIEVNFLSNGKVDNKLVVVYLLINIILLLMNIDLINNFPFFILLLLNFIRLFYFRRDGFSFYLLSVINLMILYFEFGFLIKNYLMSF